MRTFMLLGLFAMLLVAGCTAPALPSGQPQQPGVTCRNVTVVQPVTTEQCGDVQTTQQVCGLRKLPYKSVLLPKVDLCIIDGDCAGNPLSQCQHCTTAMTRCTLVIENLDQVASGTWSVSATYRIGKAGFDKGPITAVIEPNSTYSFDFQQIYVPGDPVNSANCNVTVSGEATVNDCHGETRTTRECRNVTGNANVQTTVCS